MKKLIVYLSEIGRGMSKGTDTLTVDWDETTIPTAEDAISRVIPPLYVERFELEGGGALPGEIVILSVGGRDFAYDRIKQINYETGEMKTDNMELVFRFDGSGPGMFKIRPANLRERAKYQERMDLMAEWKRCKDSFNKFDPSNFFAISPDAIPIGWTIENLKGI